MNGNQHRRHPNIDRNTPAHRFNGNGAPRAAAPSASPSGATTPGQETLTEPALLRLLLRQFAELRSSVTLYAAARMDGVRASVRNQIVQLVLAALGFVTVAGLIMLASWLVLSATAQGLGTLFGDRPWIGSLLTGLGSLVGIGVGLGCLVAARKERDRKRTVEKYESRRDRQ